MNQVSSGLQKSEVVLLIRLVILTVGILLALGLGSIDVPPFESAGEQLNQVAEARVELADDGSFRVDNFNVQRGKGNDEVRDLGRAIDVLRGSDIAGLQELAGTLFYGLSDQATQVGEALSLNYLYAPTTYRWLQPYKGSGLFSRFPVTEWSIEHLPLASDSEANPRNIIRAKVIIGDRPMTLLVSHLDRRESNSVQLDYVLKTFRETEGPVILMADLNTDHFNETLMTFIDEEGARDAIHESIGQFWRLDWIVTRGFDVVEGGYTPRGISDHAHYWVRLKFSEAQT